MKTYRNSIYVTGIISVVSLFASFKLYNGICYDISIGIFSGAVLTLITSIIGYRVTKLETLEDFYLYTQKHLREINKYDKSASIERKVDYFIDFTYKDLPDLGIAYRNICFWFDYCRKDKLYIYNKIYQPIVELEDEIEEHYWNFVWHKDGSGTNIDAMANYVDKIEKIIFEDNKNYNAFTRKIREELNNRYYSIMYGEKIYNEMLEEEENQD